MKMKNIKWLIHLNQYKYKAIILFVLLFPSIHGISQSRINVNLSYNKTGQLVLEDMPNYFSTLISYDKAGNRIRKLTSSNLNSLNNIYNDSNTISVFPIPANNDISVNFKLLKDDNVYFKIISIDGKNQYFEKKYVHSGINTHKIDISKLSKGIYILEIISSNKKYSRKIIRQ